MRDDRNERAALRRRVAPPARHSPHHLGSLRSRGSAARKPPPIQGSAKRRGGSSHVARVGLGASLTCAFAILGGGCQPAAAPTDPTDGFDRQALLAQAADGVILPRLRAFAAAAITLAGATDELAAQTREGAAHAAALAGAREGWRSAMQIWQELEVMQVGPAGTPGIMMGGQGLRDEIYSWPTVNACAIDQQLVANAFRTEGYFDAKLVTVYGLDALEYVLFREGRDNACPPAATLNAEGQWASLSDDEVILRRHDYAAAVARHLARDAAVLLSAWEPGEGNFRARFVEPGSAGSPYGNAAEAVDQVFAAMFYLELRTKDRKLGVPAGLHVDCANATCPEQLESRVAAHTVENLRANLAGFSALFFGGAADGEGVGFDDYLRAAGAESLVGAMAEAIATANARIAAMEGDAEVTLATRPQAFVEAYESLKGVGDLLKTQMVTALNLDVPQEGAGDND